MENTNELRRGNIVRESYHDNLLIVEAITTRSTINGKTLEGKKYNSMSVSDIGCVFPVYLTDDWMVKCGFEYSKESNKWFNDTILFAKTYNLYKTHDDKYLITYKGELIICTLRYVHEFQNAYKVLTGMELNIKM